MFFEGFFNSGARYAKFEVIDVNNINNNKKAGIIPSNFIGGNANVGLIFGTIIKPKTIKNTTNANKMNVNSNNVLIAIFCVLKITKLVNNIGKIDIKVITVFESGMLNLAKTSLNTIAKVWAEKAHIATFAIHKKKPIIKAKKPPIPSFPKLYAPPAKGKLVESSA